MGDPYGGEYGAGYVESLSKHHYKTENHEGRHGSQYFDFGLFCHALALYIGLKVVFIKLCAEKPVMQPFRRLGKAEHRNEKKRNGGQNGEHYSDAAERQAKAADD